MAYNPKNVPEYTLRMREIDWVFSNIHLTGKAFVEGLIREHFEGKVSQFRTNQSLCNACFSFAKENPYELTENTKDRKRHEQFLALKGQKATKIFTEFRNLWRGYTDKELQDTAKDINKDERSLLRKLQKHITRNSQLMSRARRKGRSHLVKEYRENRDELDELQNDISVLFSADSTALARRKLIHEVHYRRRHFGRSIFYNVDEYLFVHLRLRTLDPDYIEFPLRFLMHLPASLYNDLREKWLSGTDKKDIALAFNDGDISGLKERLLWLNGLLAPNVITDRSKPIKEIDISYQNECYIAMTLVAITQIEGILWDFSYYLNRKNIRIFKKEKRNSKILLRPFQWDRQRERYSEINPTTKRPIADRGDTLVSGHNLLLKTRLGSIVPPELYSYLVIEFHEKRNPLAHGTIDDVDYLPDALAALLCLETCLYNIAEYLKLTR